jgi:hypothetical protein
MEVEIMGQKTALPVGTWMMAAHISDDPTWMAVKSGRLTGFSVCGIRNSAFKSLSPEDMKDETALKTLIKNVYIKDLGEDWVAGTVSIVDTPAVPKAKFYALKCKDPETCKLSVKEKALKFGRTFSDPLYNRLLVMKSELDDMVSQAQNERGIDSNEGDNEDSSDNQLETPLDVVEKPEATAQKSANNVVENNEEVNEISDEEIEAINNTVLTLEQITDNALPLDSDSKEVRDIKMDLSDVAKDIVNTTLSVVDGLMNDTLQIAPKSDIGDGGIICTSCGQLSGPGDQYCPSCGCGLSYNIVGRPACSSCGCVCSPGSDYCPRCGAKLPDTDDDPVNNMAD